jgi:dienelactone hydrolase
MMHPVKTLLVAMAACLIQSPTPAQAAPVDCGKVSYQSAAGLLCESRNIAISTQNPLGHKDLTAGVLQATLAYQQARAAALAADPERKPNPDSCTTGALCPIDPRLENWPARGGVVKPVLYTSRSGATMSGHIWATAAGPAKRPGVVFINGSVVGFEETYWFVAQTLAKAGFVVMTFDAQGEGMSDQFGKAPDQREDALAGTPTLGILGPTAVTGFSLGGNGLPFYDGGVDALDFFLSTPTKRYVPRDSRSSGTSHKAKQTRRVAAGLNASFNPLWRMLDATKIGLAGHSYGAEAASWLTQRDPRVSAAVALDNLCTPISPSPDEFTSFAANNPDLHGSSAPYGFATGCFGAPPGPAPRITKPALGITGDYISPTPYLRAPSPLGKSRASLAYTQKGVDTGQVIIRGGTHLDFNDESQALPASLRGIDLVAWYTTAWFKKYLQRDPRGERMLLTQRWRNDAESGRVDPAKDPNAYSWHFRSRLNVHRISGQPFKCDDLRTSCAGQTTAANDGWTGPYSFVAASR